jgi:hypothetical protein
LHKEVLAEDFTRSLASIEASLGNTTKPVPIKRPTLAARREQVAVIADASPSMAVSK